MTQDAAHAQPPSAVLLRAEREAAERPFILQGDQPGWKVPPGSGWLLANEVEPGARGDRPPSLQRGRSFGKLKEGGGTGVSMLCMHIATLRSGRCQEERGLCCVLFACGLPLESVLRSGLLQGCESRRRETVPLLCYAFAV